MGEEEEEGEKKEGKVVPPEEGEKRGKEYR